MVEQYIVTYRRVVEDTFNKQKEDRIAKFVCNEQGLYVHNTDERNVVMSNTVEHNKTK